MPLSETFRPSPKCCPPTRGKASEPKAAVSINWKSFHSLEMLPGSDARVAEHGLEANGGGGIFSGYSGSRPPSRFLYVIFLVPESRI